MEASATTVDKGARKAPPKKTGTTDKTKAERRLAYMLCAPAVIAMLIVTGYPIAYAV